MIKILIFMFAFFPVLLNSQAIDEKLLFTLTNYHGDADAYSLAYDPTTGTNAYVYYIEEENKSFLISSARGGSISEKYDGVSAMDIKFDSQGNYYTITTNYREDYGIDNNFLISNGNVIKAFDLIEGYSAYVNNVDEYVFIFQEFDQYKIGYYSAASGFRQSEGYDLVKAIYKSYSAGEGDIYGEEMFFKNSDGERGFIAIKNGKAHIIFGNNITPTNYSDIMEYSFTTDNFGNLAYIAKLNGRFYSKNGDEFVVVGTQEYSKYDNVIAPVLFTPDNRPLYVVIDSVNQDLYNFHLMLGNTVQQSYLDNAKTQRAPDFNGGIYEMRIVETGNISYMANHYLNFGTDEEYNVNTYIIRNMVAEDLGVNVGLIRYGANGEIIYGAKENMHDKLYQIFLLRGNEKIKINSISYDAYSDYGFTPDGKIYYIAENFNYDTENNYKSSNYFIYLDGRIIAQPQGFVSFQSFNYSESDPARAIHFDSKGNYTYVTEEIIDTVNYIYESHVWTNGVKLPYRSNSTVNKGAFNFISNLSYLDDRLFYIGNITRTDKNNTNESQILIDNIPLGKTYNSITNLSYDPVLKTISFRGASGREIYDVAIRL